VRNLKHRERPAVFARALLTKHNRAGRSDADAGGCDQKKRRGDDNQNRCADAVDHAFDHQRPGNFRRRAKHEHRSRAHHVEVGPRDAGLDEIGHEPRLDAFDFARGDGFLNAVQLRVAAGENDAAH
jgi:hypothetical protein